MAASRRGISVDDDARWVFNRLARDYLARPGYPEAVLARLAAIAGVPSPRVVDLGAGTGHLAVPLASRGARVHAVEPAREMLRALEGQAAGAGAAAARVVPIHAAAEETGLAAASFDLAVVADALHWIDADRAGAEIARLLAPGAALAVIEPRLADTPFLAALRERIARANFKARPAPPPADYLFAVAVGAVPAEERFVHEVALDDPALAAVLRSLSYVGPAIGPAAVEALVEDARALARRHGGAIWRRELRLLWARRG